MATVRPGYKSFFLFFFGCTYVHIIHLIITDTVSINVISLWACTNPHVGYYFGSCHLLSVSKNRPPSPPTPEAQWL